MLQKNNIAAGHMSEHSLFILIDIIFVDNCHVHISSGNVVFDISDHFSQFLCAAL